MEESPLSDIRLVLVAPLYSGNVGAVARLATNFALNDVVLVTPQCEWNDANAQQYACRLGQEMLQSFRVVSTLAEAIGDVQTVIAFTRRTGDWRRPDLALSELAAATMGRKVALVFGREDNGLTREEVLQCTQICSIPTASLNPSLNLSHAVAVVLAKLFSDRNNVDRKTNRESRSTSSDTCHEPAAVSQFAAMMEDFRQTMLDVGLNRAGNPERLLPHIQRLLQRAAISDKEAEILRGFLRQVQKSVGTRSRRSDRE